MIGGLLAVDTKLREGIKRIPWVVVILIGVGALTFAAWSGYYYGLRSYVANGTQPLNQYNAGGWIPLAVFYIIISFKLNYVIKDNSRLGKFIMKFSPSTLGVMSAGWVFCSVLPATNTALRAMLLSLSEALWSSAAPFIATFIIFFLNLSLFVVFFALVYWLTKVPIIGKLFTFQDIRFPRKKKQTES